MHRNPAIVKQLNLSPISSNRKIENINQFGLLSIPLMSERKIVRMEEILYMKSESNYTSICMKDNSLVVCKTLKWFIPKMENYFFRVHQSFLINLKFLSSYNLKDHCIVLRDGSQIPVARTKRKELLKILN
ncbi:MAG: LytTR family DNA-binding domain-containing protein [Saprospiraceae bacterium]|nr:LytTR family DNA-binding domain-containing protein [Saprospiraceae bacterium]